MVSWGFESSIFRHGVSRKEKGSANAMIIINALQPLPWEKLPNSPLVAVTPKGHLIRWYTSGFE